MGRLLEEIIAITASEEKSINIELDADTELLSSRDKKAEKVVADTERDVLLNNFCKTILLIFSNPNNMNKHEIFSFKIDPDASQSSSKRNKRTKAAMEEELLAEKCRHDMDLEVKRFKLEEVVKMAAIEQEEKKLELELIREKRLAEENRQRADVFDALKQSLEMMQQVLLKK